VIDEIVDFLSVLGSTIGGLGCLLIALGCFLLVAIIVGDRRDRS
jgi:hypothetical protein